jgi:hypothetical protein
MSLESFIKTNHAKLISMTREKIAKRSGAPRPRDLEENHGVHILLDQLRDALVKAKRDPSGHPEPDPLTNPEIAQTAALHGHDLLRLGYSVDDVVHDYGDVCQAVTELAVDLNAPISTADFHTLNRCLDNAIAAAVSAWSVDREAAVAPANGLRGTRNDERLRRLVSGAITLFEQLRAGTVAPGGAAAALMGRNLAEMRALLDASSS